ncbi:MAG: hypothetical protein ACFCVK_23030 [Acidimicrobiales bacterium]
MASVSRITPTGVMADIDPLGWRSVTSQRARLERQRQQDQQPAARRQQPRAAKTRRWPQPRAFTNRFAQLVAGHHPREPRLPAPVTAYAGRYETAIVWREDTETFAAFLTDTNRAGELEARWIGAHPAQYPTVESLAEALNAYGVGLDQGSLALAQSYQHQVWATIGACHLTGTTLDHNRPILAVITPNGQIQPLAPAPQRDRRSLIFGPPATPTWGPHTNARGTLETARIVLDYTDSTTRTDNQLFNDARTLAITTIRHWPATFTVSIAALHTWTRTRNPIPVATTGQPIEHLHTNPPPQPQRAPTPGPPPHTAIVDLHAGPTLHEVTAATLSHTTNTSPPPPTGRPPKRRPDPHIEF